MVWINYEHFNSEVPPGVFGGAACMCLDCVTERYKQAKKKEKEALDNLAESLYSKYSAERMGSGWKDESAITKKFWQKEAQFWVKYIRGLPNVPE